MQLEELDALIDKTATLMVQYDRRGAVIDERLSALVAELRELVQRLPATFQHSSEEMLQALPSRLGDIATHALNRPLQDYRESLRAATGELERTKRVAAAQLDGLRNLHRVLLWKTVGTVALALAVLLAGGAWLSVHYAGVIQDNRVSADLMRAYNRADVVLCGDGGLCANVDAKHARYGDRGQYVPVKPRQEAPTFARHR